jgi:predicted Rossmann-fold nucleotide-binding protein
MVPDHKGFYQPLKALLDHYVGCGMLSCETMAKLHFAKTAEELLDLLED